MTKEKKCCDVGTVFYTVWGYEQTNVEFYEVTHSTAKMVTVRELETAQTENKGEFTGCAVPLKGRYKQNSKPIKRKLDTSHFEQPIISITSYQLARMWDNRPKDFTTNA